MKKKVIFVCSANYYRSRYAEHYFNWLASREQLGWKADSRGLMVGFWGNIGPISHHTVDALQQRGIPLEDQPRDRRPSRSPTWPRPISWSPSRKRSTAP